MKKKYYVIKYISIKLGCNIEIYDTIQSNHVKEFETLKGFKILKEITEKQWSESDLFIRNNAGKYWYENKLLDLEND